MRKICVLLLQLVLCSCHMYSETTPVNSGLSNVYRPPLGLIRACGGLDSTRLANEPECDFYRCEVRLNDLDRSSDPTCKYFLIGDMYTGYKR